MNPFRDETTRIILGASLAVGLTVAPGSVLAVDGTSVAGTDAPAITALAPSPSIDADACALASEPGVEGCAVEVQPDAQAGPEDEAGAEAAQGEATPAAAPEATAAAAPEADPAPPAERQAEAGMSLERTDEADGQSKLSMTEQRSFKATVSVEGMTEEELRAANVQWTLTRDHDATGLDWKLFPNQYLGGELSSWKTVATKSKDEAHPCVPLFTDITTTVSTVDGKPTLVLDFKTGRLFGFDGLDVRDRALVRSAMMDYLGTYQLKCIVNGKAVSSHDLEFRPYDAFRTQDEIDAELYEAVAEAKANGLYAEVREYGTSAEGRPMRAVFVASSADDLKNFQELKNRMEADPAAVMAELKAGNLDYKVPVVYSNVHADEIVAPDAVMEFLRNLTRNRSFEYRRITGLTEEGKAELATEMDRDRTVWSSVIADKATGIGYIRGSGGDSNGHNYDGAGINNSASDLSDADFDRYYNSERTTFDPAEILKKMFFILVPSENVDARAVNSRTNGNGFDLNRDNTYQTQPETQAMARLITEWDPLSLHEFHGYYQQYQVEPCSPTHDPNNEYDLFIDTAFAQGEAFAAASIANNRSINSVQMPLRDYLKRQADGSRFWEAPFDDMSTSYTPQYAMMHGTNAYTVEAPYASPDAVLALQYGMIGNADFVAANRDRMFMNQLMRFYRGIQNIDANEVRKYYVNQKDEPGAEADVFRPQDNENHNFFPEYYVIPVESTSQQDRAAARETIELLLRNGVRLSALTHDVAVGEKTYKAGSVVVNMRQAKRNMANCVLYPNLVIQDWTQYSLYSEPVTNFSALRGFDMDTVRTVGAFDGALAGLDHAPEMRTTIVGQGPVSIVSNSGIEAVRAINSVLKGGGTVGLVTEGEHEGRFVMSSSLLDSIKDDFVLEVLKQSATPVAKVISNGIKIFVPKAYADDAQVTDKNGKSVGMVGYRNRLNTNGNWDPFALARQMGFTLTSDLGHASIVVGSQYPSNADEVAAKIAAGTPYIGYTADALQFVKDEGLADASFNFAPINWDWWGYDALSKVEYPEHDISTATYVREGDYTMYGYGGGYIITAPDGAKVLIKVSDGTGADRAVRAGMRAMRARAAKGDPAILEAFMTSEEIAKYKGSIQAIAIDKDGKHMRLFANTLTNKAHQSDDYRYLSTSIFADQLTDEEFKVEVKVPTTTERPMSDSLALADFTPEGGWVNVAGEDVPGRFVWKDPGIRPEEGTHEYAALFVPDDGSEPFEVMVEVTVLPSGASVAPAVARQASAPRHMAPSSLPQTGDEALPAAGVAVSGIALIAAALRRRILGEE